ncbi:transcriptional regulator [Salinisphaera sp. PC39]|uniref:MerR family transcriptional regulator n=1 Tax=Salinisphaera sp. PC39 TaxID=1304156 RepID=UPI00334202DC
MRYTIGEVARRSGCIASTIRYYERIGLLPPARRGDNGYRYYDDRDLERLEFVTRARALGFSVAAIRSLLRLAGHPGEPCDAVDHRVAEQLSAVRERIARLRRLETRLKRLQDACDGGYSVGDCGILAALTDSGHRRGKRLS